MTTSKLMQPTIPQVIASFQALSCSPSPVRGSIKRSAECLSSSPPTSKRPKTQLRTRTPLRLPPAMPEVQVRRTTIVQIMASDIMAAHVQAMEDVVRDLVGKPGLSILEGQELVNLRLALSYHKSSK